MSDSLLLVLFNGFIVLMLIIDLGVAQRRAHFPSMKEAIGWTALWVFLALCFGAFLWFDRGSAKALEYFSGYLVEEALSVDNVFVFVVILTYFAVPHEHQHTVLFWGVLSAIIFRALFIVAGSALVAKFHWVLYILGVFLLLTALKLVRQNDVQIQPEKNPILRLARRFFPVTESYVGGKFLVRKDGRLALTPLLLVLLVVETTDIAFATDSIPAIFALTRDTTIIYTSNIFAVLGLRALYFAVAGFMRQFRFLRYGLSAVLGFIGIKMLIDHWVTIHILWSLITIFTIIAISVAASLLLPAKTDEQS